MFERILIAYDGSSAADAMIHQLDLVGSSGEVEATVLVAPELFTKEGVGAPADPFARMHYYASQGTRLLRTLHPNWIVRTEVRNAPPIWAILDVIESWQPNLLAMAAHSKAASTRLLLGSVSHKVLLDATCSVLICRPTPHVEGRPLRILAGVDGSSFSKRAVELLRTAHWPMKPELTLMTALDAVWISELQDLAAGLPPSAPSDEEAIAQHMLDEYEGPLADHYTIARRIPRAPAKHAILDLAEELLIDLIVLGARGKSPFERLLMGSVSSSVSLHAPCSVLVVR